MPSSGEAGSGRRRPAAEMLSRCIRCRRRYGFLAQWLAADRVAENPGSFGKNPAGVEPRTALPWRSPAGCDGNMPDAPNTLALLRLGRLELDPALRALQPGQGASGLVATATHLLQGCRWRTG